MSVEALSLPELERVERSIAIARRRGIDALHTAVALDIVAPIAGRAWYPICCWCLDRVAYDLPDTHVHRLAMTTGADAGGCGQCPYSGPDTLVASLVSP